MINTTHTTCPYCAVQCTFAVEHDGNSILALRSTPSCPVAHGSVCKKGLAALEEVGHPERLLTPLIRKNGVLTTSSWEEAFAVIADNIKHIQATHGRDAYGIFGGGSLTNEKTYLLGKFARVAVKTANIDYNGRYCMSSAAAAMNAVYGMDRGLPFPLETLSGAACLVLWGSNLAETLPPISQFVSKARKNGAKIIVVDPRATPSSKLGTHHIAVQPGGDLALALGLLHCLIGEALIDASFLERRVSGWAEVAASVQPNTPAWASEHCGVPAQTILEMARIIGKAAQHGQVLVLSGRGAEQSSRGVDTVKALIHLALSVGGLYAPLTGQGNGQGGREHGQKADQLPGYRQIENPAHRAFMAGFWGIAEAELPRKGKSAQELLESCGDSVQGLFVLGSNPAISAANSLRVTQSLQNLKHLVVVDFFLSETAQLADVVLPGSLWLEEDGTMTNLEGRVLRRRQVQSPAVQHTDWQILCELALRLGVGDKFAFASVEQIFNEFAAATKGAKADYSGITYAKLEPNGIFYPCPDFEHVGTPHPFAEHFMHPDGLAHLAPIAYSAPTLEPDEVFFTTGRNPHHYQSGTQTRRNPKLNPKAPYALLELHPNLAMQHQLLEGEKVRLESGQGNAEFVVTISLNIRPDTLYTSFHYAGLETANRLTASTLDPVSRMPDFKVTAVRLVRSAKEAKKEGKVQPRQPLLLEGVRGGVAPHQPQHHLESRKPSIPITTTSPPKRAETLTRQKQKPNANNHSLENFSKESP
jgi:assimilatory nitrate reductase catalytic subunit